MNIIWKNFDAKFIFIQNEKEIAKKNREKLLLKQERSTKWTASPLTVVWYSNLTWAHVYRLVDTKTIYRIKTRVWYWKRHTFKNDHEHFRLIWVKKKLKNSKPISIGEVELWRMFICRAYSIRAWEIAETCVFVSSVILLQILFSVIWMGCLMWAYKKNVMDHNLWWLGVDRILWSRNLDCISLSDHYFPIPCS